MGLITGGLICYAQDGDEDGDGVFDRRDKCPGTPANTPVSHNGCPLPQYPATVAVDETVVVQDEVITLSDQGPVLFAFDSAELGTEAPNQLAPLMAKLSNADVVFINIVGYTDSQGADIYNQKLSERRANSVATYLISQGIPPAKVTSQGMGENQPVADNATEQGRAQNRRVELHIKR